MTRRWRIYYDGGATFDWQQGRPEDAPAFGVLAIVQDGEPGDPHALAREIITRFDWYWWTGAEWYGGDRDGFVDRLLHALPVHALKQGRTTSNRGYREILMRVQNDPDFPKVVTP